MPEELAADECGCAPTEAELRALADPGSRRRLLLPSASFSRRRALGLGALGLLAVGGVAGPLVPAAFAATYPDWDDVQRAMANESSKAKEVKRIQSLIAGLESEVARTREIARQRADEFYVAQQEYFDAAQKADSLQSQADEQAKTAQDAADKAGRLAAQLYRNGGDDTSLELFFAGSAANADDLLARLGQMDKLLERNQDVYAEAVTARDSAQSLSDQAAVARDERDKLKQVAEQKMVESQQAADAAQAALDAQNARRATLQAQLAALQDKTAKTVKDYKKGEEIRKAEEERRRKAEEARRAEEERKAREAAEAANNGGGGGGGGGAPAASGWIRPSFGWKSSGYGPRSVQCGNGYCASGYHYGVDMAGGCGASIFAAFAGTVVYAGYNGGYGNYVKIDHGGGIATGYAHIRPGGFFVGYGQWVNAGQVIASEGNTGNAFGCHLHFETYVNGFPVNPSDFMAARGVWL